MQDENGDMFRTSDLGLIAMLSLTFPIVSKDVVDARRVFFLFKNTKELEAYVSDYYSGNLRINPLVLMNQLKIIKHRIYDSD